MSVGDIMDGAFKLLKANFKGLVVTLMLVALPFEAMSAYAERNLTRTTASSQPVTSFTQLLAELNVSTADVYLVLGSLAALLVVTPLVAGVVCRTVAVSYLGEQLTAGQAARAGAKRFFALLVSSIVVHVLEAAGFCLCFIPAALLMALFVLTAPAIVIEGLGPFAGIGRSWRLVRHRFWPVLGMALLAGLLAIVVQEMIGFLPQELAAAIASPHVKAVVDTVVLTIVQAFNWAFIATVATLLYFDQRIRQEGLDLEVMAADLG
jgi:hypothetical protein